MKEKTTEELKDAVLFDCWRDEKTQKTTRCRPSVRNKEKSETKKKMQGKKVVKKALK